jgi:hypothetical protein
VIRWVFRVLGDARLAAARPALHLLVASARAGCTERITKAEPLENQLVEWLRAFQPDLALRQRVVKAIGAHVNQQDGGPDRRAELAEQLRRIQDLYVLGDLTKAKYIMRRQAIQDELERLGVVPE